MRRWGIGLLLGLLSCAAWADEAIWKQLQQGGYVLLMRHAQTVQGVGDPPNFRLGDCSTQRNVAEAGKAQATRTGEAFRRHEITLHEVRSSAWCRCIDTARLAFGKAEVWPALNSFFEDRGDEAQQTAQVLAAAAQLKPPHNLMLVTHQVNITALTGDYPASGEIFVARPAGPGAKQLTVVGKFKVP